MSYSLNNNFQHHDEAAHGEPQANIRPYLVEVEVKVVMTLPVDASNHDDARSAVDDRFIAEAFNTHEYVHLGVVESTVESVEPAP